MIPSGKYKVLVIGGGHAGAEAAWAAANLLRHSPGCVALLTMDPGKIGAMSCNPAIGGLAKGQMVREIDALGGLMGLAADATGIQFRMLNRSKGPAVHGPRCQSDKYCYARHVQKLLRSRPNLRILQGVVEDFIIDKGRCIGVQVRMPDHCGPRTNLLAGATVLTTGTFMRGLMHTGQQKTNGGRVGEAASVELSTALRQLGLKLGRLKTGTPPRLAAETVDFTGLEVQHGDDQPTPFSDQTHIGSFPVLPQRPCWITGTNPAIHDTIRANLNRAPMYNGQIQTAGPRYCPSIEDKVVRFADRTAHHVFLEPESLNTNEIYCNGISTSLPSDVQDLIVHRLPGCERAKILHYGYAVEYDMVWPHQIDATCLCKTLPGLFLAGQINGTSGYEEAAGQGLLAGLNALRYTHNQTLVRLERDQAYIGVMMDDLVTKTPREPYRMFTSRAEHRLRLRADNAGPRLTPLGRKLGLIDDQHWQNFQNEQQAVEALRHHLDTHKLDGRPLRRWALRTEVDAKAIARQLEDDALPDLARQRKLIELVLADLRYAGYINRQDQQLKNLATQTVLPQNLDYHSVPGLRTEAAQTLQYFRPATLGQAGRLAGVNPADVMILSIAASRYS